MQSDQRAKQRLTYTFFTPGTTFFFIKLEAQRMFVYQSGTETLERPKQSPF